MRSMPRGSKESYLIAESRARTSDDHNSLSLRRTMSNQSPEDHFYYGCFGRPTRRSPAVAGTNNNNNNNSGRRGLFHIGQGGRTVLPPLHLPFRTSRSPVPDASFSTNQFPQQDPTQGRNEYNAQNYGQAGWPSNTVPGHHPSGTMDPRYSTAQPAYGSYPGRGSQQIVPEVHDSRTLPPLNVPQGQVHPSSSNMPMVPGAHIRSPTAGYPASYYQDHTQQTSTSYYPSAPDPRNLPPPVAPVGFDPSAGVMPRRGSMSVDRTVPGRMGSMHGPSPYPRNPAVGAPMSYEPEPPVEPTIKKKRKRADAEQLKVLNDTYNRTAFPSTEERIELARKLGMSARSVQIWFQNKRQAMRQSTRQSSTSVPPTTNEPFPGSSHSSSPSGLSTSGGYGVHPSNPMGPSSISQAYGIQQPGSRLIPSPTPSAHHRGRSPDDDDRDLRRFGSRPY